MLLTPLSATRGGSVMCNVCCLQQELLCVAVTLLLTSATRGGNLMIVMTLPPLVPTNVDITVSPVWQDVTYYLYLLDVEACRDCIVSCIWCYEWRLVERSETVVVGVFIVIITILSSVARLSSKLLIVVYLYSIELLIAVSTVVSSKNRRVIFWQRCLLTQFLALQLVNFFISTRRLEACRRLIPLPACYPRQCASNGRNIVDFGLSQHRHFFGPLF